MSKKQQAKIRAYNKAKAEVEQELKASGKWACIFTGIPIPDHYTWKDVPFHHLKGRDGELISDKKFIRPYMDEHAHTGDYGIHNKPIEVLKSQWWWRVYMSNLKEIDLDLWHYWKIREESS